MSHERCDPLLVARGAQLKNPMKHGKKILKIGRKAPHRKATLQQMSAALFEHKRITTTFGKAKALRRFVEPVITTAKDNSTHARRLAFKKLGDKEAVKRLYEEVATAVGDRPGGYTRIIKLGQRGGDAAEMAMVELVDFNDVKPEGSGGRKKKTRRSRRRRSASEATAPVAAAPATEAAPEELEPVTSSDPVAEDVDASETDAPGTSEADTPEADASGDEALTDEAGDQPEVDEAPEPSSEQEASDSADDEQKPADG